MQQKLSPTISRLAKECIQKMRNSLGFFSSKEDTQIVDKLEDFLNIQRTSEEILKKFDISKSLCSAALKTLAKQFISQAISFQTQHSNKILSHINVPSNNLAKLSLRALIFGSSGNKVPSDIISYSFKDWSQL